MYRYEWTRVKAKPNVVSLKGGKWFIPPSSYNEFLEYVFMNCESMRFHLSEVAQRHSKLFFDLDYETAQREGDVRKCVEDFVNNVFVGEHRAVLKWRDGSPGCHAIFPTVVVEKRTRTALTKALKKLIPSADERASGLRLPGCWGQSMSKRPYFPLAIEASIFCLEGEGLTATIPKFNGRNKLMPSMNYREEEQPLNRIPTKRIRQLQEHIRSLKEEWASLEIDQVRNWGSKGVTMTVKGPGQTHCEIIGRAHKSNRIFFSLTNDCRLLQKCFKCHRRFHVYKAPLPQF